MTILNHMPQSDAGLAQMAIRVAEVTNACSILCVTETGALAEAAAKRAAGRTRIIAASANADTCARMQAMAVETIHLPILAADRFRQLRHVLSVALQAGRVAPGDLLVCVVAASLYPQEGAFLIVTEVEPSSESLPVTELIRLTDSIRPIVLEAALVVAGKIGRVVSRGGVRSGAMFMLGDSVNVLRGSRQTIPNPLHGHEDRLRKLTNPAIHDSLVELAKLDGAFVVRGDGFIQTAAVYLAAGATDVELPEGLGARHVAAAAVTARTAATAVVVSATDGHVRVFSGGRLVLKFDPEAPYSPVKIED